VNESKTKGDVKTESNFEIRIDVKLSPESYRLRLSPNACRYKGRWNVGWTKAGAILSQKINGKYWLLSAKGAKSESLGQPAG